MEFQNEIRKGFNSVFKFKCKICGIKSSIYSENINESKYLGFNLAVINGTLAVGMYFGILNQIKYLLYTCIFYSLKVRLSQWRIKNYLLLIKKISSLIFFILWGVQIWRTSLLKKYATNN